MASPTSAAVFGIHRTTGTRSKASSKTAIGTTPLDTAYSDNPFLDPEAIEEFKSNRALIQEYLPKVGGKSSQ